MDAVPQAASSVVVDDPPPDPAVFGKWKLQARQPGEGAPQLPPLFTYRAG